jgi:hypothetical protein
MEQLEEVISELLALTRGMRDAGDPDTFGQVIHRRGELIQRLCSGRFDPSDHRLGLIVSEGSELQKRMESRCDSLRDQIASLDLAAIHVRGVGFTLSPPGQGLDVCG